MLVFYFPISDFRASDAKQTRARVKEEMQLRLDQNAWNQKASKFWETRAGIAILG
jgi:hypothetical protein